ncbi:MAG: winged helix-turn-helix transcriptional regulator [Candidatus Hodarchaeota archaeon]
MSEKNDLGVSTGDMSPEPISSNILKFKATPLQERIIQLAQELMENRYLLDSELLYTRCVRFFKDVDVRAIDRALDGLLRNNILVDGKAVSRLNLLENENRGRIHSLVKRNPGLSVTKIANILKISVTTVKWHLKMLEKFESVRCLEIEETKAYYFDFYLKKNLDKIFIAMNKKSMKLIAKTISENQGISFIDLLEKLDVPRTTLMRKIKELITVNIIQTRKESNQIASLSLNPGIEEVFDQFKILN